MYIILFFVLFIPTAISVWILVYANAHPEGDAAIPESGQADTLQYDLNEDGQREKVDSSLVLEAIEPEVGNFSHWRGARTVVFYFSAACSHCKRTFPLFQDFADSLEREGVQAIALAVEGNSHAGIQDFARERNAHMPFYHDEDRRFGQLYGYRTVPSILIVDEEGRYMRHAGFHDTTPRLIRMGLMRMRDSHAHKDKVGT